MVRTAFASLGLVLMPSDFSLPEWPERMAGAGLSVVGLHVADRPSTLLDFAQTADGHAVLARFRELGLEVEYEMHALMELLPRELFGRHPELFRADEDGNRVADCNLCPTNDRALETVGENAVRLAEKLTPTTHRYYY